MLEPQQLGLRRCASDDFEQRLSLIRIDDPPHHEAAGNRIPPNLAIPFRAFRETVCRNINRLAAFWLPSRERLRAGEACPNQIRAPLAPPNGDELSGSNHAVVQFERSAHPSEATRKSTRASATAAWSLPRSCFGGIPLREMRGQITIHAKFGDAAPLFWFEAVAF